MYDTQVKQFAKMLKNLDACMVKAAAYADGKKFEVNNFADCRLIADMYPFTKQVQSACDSAKFYASRLSGKEAPKHEDTEKTWNELRERIKKCTAYLETFSAKDFTGAKDIKVKPSWAEGKWIAGDEYAVEMQIPNFYFHMTTAYAILRANGVDIGKMDYMGNVNLQA